MWRAMCRDASLPRWCSRCARILRRRWCSSSRSASLRCAATARADTSDFCTGPVRVVRVRRGASDTPRKLDGNPLSDSLPASSAREETFRACRRPGWAGARRPPQELRRTVASNGRPTRSTRLLINQTFSGSLVPWPRLARFANFPFHFPFRGEKGSAPLKDGLEQFQRPSKQHLRHRLHFNGGPLGIFGQSQRKRREGIAPKSLKYENP